MEDQQIIALFFDRNEQAVKEADAKYGRLCFSLAKGILGSGEDAEECVNDTWLAAWNSIPPARPRYFSAFLCKITRNLSLKKLEFSSAAKRAAEAAASFEELEGVLRDDGFARAAEAEELGSVVSSFLRTEKELARNVFLRKYWFFDSVGEIAARYGLNENTVKSMLSRTRGRLRDYLRKEGIGI